jgi:hypothetical protein
MEKMKNAYKVLVGKTNGRKQLKDPSWMRR